MYNWQGDLVNSASEYVVDRVNDNQSGAMKCNQSEAISLRVYPASSGRDCVIDKVTLLAVGVDVLLTGWPCQQWVLMSYWQGDPVSSGWWCSLLLTRWPCQQWVLMFYWQCHPVSSGCWYIWGWARYLSVTEACHNIESLRLSGEETFCFFWNLKARVVFEPAMSDFLSRQLYPLHQGPRHSLCRKQEHSSSPVYEYNCPCSLRCVLGCEGCHNTLMTWKVRNCYQKPEVPGKHLTFKKNRQSGCKSPLSLTKFTKKIRDTPLSSDPGSATDLCPLCFMDTFHFVH